MKTPLSSNKTLVIEKLFRKRRRQLKTNAITTTIYSRSGIVAGVVVAEADSGSGRRGSGRCDSGRCGSGSVVVAEAVVAEVGSGKRGSGR